MVLDVDHGDVFFPSTVRCRSVRAHSTHSSEQKTNRKQKMNSLNCDQKNCLTEITEFLIQLTGVAAGGFSPHTVFDRRKHRKN